MKRKDYLLHLIGELSSFMLASEPSRMVLSLHQEKEGIHISIMDNHERQDSDLEDIKKALDSPERPELAAYYGGLAGLEPLGKARLNLVGWEIMHSEVKREGTGVKIDLWIGGDDFNPALFTKPQD